MELRESHPEYNKSIKFVLIDWDDYGSHSVTTSRDIPRRSTLVLIRDRKEIGRLVAETSVEKIKLLLDKGLK
ncbi:MAG: hypothetical protein VX941_09500 [Pseudomonadota bacterium]|nr:hypothetical protein [Pseudomonadota bacterium]